MLHLHFSIFFRTVLSILSYQRFSLFFCFFSHRYSARCKTRFACQPGNIAKNLRPASRYWKGFPVNEIKGVEIKVATSNIATVSYILRSEGKRQGGRYERTELKDQRLSFVAGDHHTTTSTPTTTPTAEAHRNESSRRKR